MKKVWIFILALGFLISFAAASYAAEQIKIGYVDMQKALNLCDAGKEAKKIISGEAEKLQKNFIAKQKELEKIKEELEKRASVLSESARTDKERDYQAKLRDLQRIQRDYEEDMRRKDQELSANVLKNLAAIITKLGEDGKYSMILERNQPTIIYISSAFDLTDEVIKIANQKK